MTHHLTRPITFLTICLLLYPTAAAAVQGGNEPVMAAAGNDLQVVILRISEDGSQVAGVLRQGKGCVPFTGRNDGDGGGDVLKGEFQANGQGFSFETHVMLRHQVYDMIGTIKDAASRYNCQLSDSEMGARRARNAADDEAQRVRVNAIRETHDYRDNDGTRVNVPIHYQSVLGDGKGNYVLTNNSYQPGGEFQELKQWK